MRLSVCGQEDRRMRLSLGAQYDPLVLYPPAGPVLPTVAPKDHIIDTSGDEREGGTGAYGSSIRVTRPGTGKQSGRPPKVPAQSRPGETNKGPSPRNKVVVFFPEADA